MSLGAAMPSCNGSLMSTLGVTFSQGLAVYPLLPSSCHRHALNVGESSAYSNGNKRLGQLNKRFLATSLSDQQNPVRGLHKLQRIGQGRNKQGKIRISCCQRKSLFVEAYMQFNEVAKFLGRQLKSQNVVQLYGQYQGIIKAHLSRLREGIFAHNFRWREGIFFIRCAAYAATMVVLGVLFLYGKARAQAYIDQRVLPSVASVMGDYLGRKLNLGRVQRVSPLGITLESCSVGPHSEEFSCGEFPSVRLRIRPLASLKRQQIVIDAVVVEPHILIAQKEDWTWLGIPTPLENSLEKHSSNEEGIDHRTKTRRCAREQTAIHRADERKRAARKWAQEGYIFADTEEPSLLGRDDALPTGEVVNCDSMNPMEEEVTLERSFFRHEVSRDHVHHKCMEGICKSSGRFDLDNLDGSFILKIPIPNVKRWFIEKMMSLIWFQLGRSVQKNESLSQRVTLQRRNLDHSAAAARRYFENLDKGQQSDVENGGYSGGIGLPEERNKGMEDQDEHDWKSVANKMDEDNFLPSTLSNKEVADKNHHAMSRIGSTWTNDSSVSLKKLDDVPLMDRDVRSLGHGTISSHQYLEHSSMSTVNSGKGSIYKALVQAIHDSCQTTGSSKTGENRYETQAKESVCVENKIDKGAANYSSTTDSQLQKISGDINSNDVGDSDIARFGLYRNICENSLEEPHEKVTSTKALEERGGKEWSQNNLAQGSPPVLASLITSRSITQTKSVFGKDHMLHIPYGSILMAFSDHFNTFMKSMEGYVRNKINEHAAKSVAVTQKRVNIALSEQLLPVVALDSVVFRSGTLMLLGYGDGEPRIMENVNGHLNFQNKHERVKLQLGGRPKEWRTACPSRDGGELFVNAFVDYPQQNWHVTIQAMNLFAPLFENLLEIPIAWSNGRASGKVHIFMSRGEQFPKLHGQLDVKGLEFQVLDSPSSFSALHGSLCFEGQRIFLHNASCIFGEVPLEVSGDFGINPEDGEYHLMCQVPNVEVNALMRALNARPPVYPVAGSLSAVFNCQGPLDAPILVGSAVISKKSDDCLYMPISVAYESVRQNKDIGAVAAFDRVPLSYVSANFTFNMDNCMADLYGIRATLVDGGEIRGAGNAWICEEGEMDDNAVDLNFSGYVHFDNVVRHYVPDGIQVMPVKLSDINVDTKVFGSILRPRYDIKWAATKAEGSFTDARGDIFISDEAITINASSIAFDLLTKIQIAYPHLHCLTRKNSDPVVAVAPDILGFDADLRLRGFDILGLSYFGSIGSPKSMHMKLSGKTKFQGRVVKSRSVDEKVTAQEKDSSYVEYDGIKASRLVGDVLLSGIKLNQLLIAPQLTGSFDISSQCFKLNATGRPDENLLIEIIGPLHFANSEPPSYDSFKRKVSLSLQKGHLRSNIFFQPSNLASLEVRHLQLDELELASLRGMVQKAEVQLNFQKRRGQGHLCVMRPRFSGVQGEFLDLSARWSGDVITIEKSVLKQAYSRYELQGEYVLPGTRDRFSSEREKGGSMLKRAMAGQLGNLITSMGRWRLRLEVPNAEVAEMLPFARLLSRSSDPAVLSRSKEIFMQGVQNIQFHVESLKKQLEASQGNIFVSTDEETPEAIPLPGLAELKGRWQGNFDASGGGNGDTTADFDFHGEDWEWGAYKTQRVVAVGSYSNNDGFHLDKIFIQRDKVTIHADGTLLGPRPNLHFAVLNFPFGLVPTFLQVFESSAMTPVPYSWAPLSPIKGILHMEGDLRGSTVKPECDVQVRLLDGAIGGVDLKRAEIVASITSANRFVFDANFEPVIQTGHVHVIGSLPVSRLGADAVVEEDTEIESSRPMWVVRWMRDKGKITGGSDVNGNKFQRERGEEDWEVHLTESLKGLDWNLMETGAVKVDATVKDGGMMLITALSPYVKWHQGSADINLQVRGTVDQPIFDGAATFHRASVYSPVLATALSNFGGTFNVKSNQLCINGLEGRVGRKGRFLVKGKLPLRSSKIFSGDKIEMKTEILEVRAKNVFSGQVDSQIEVAGSILEPDVSGMIKLSHGEAYLPQDKGTRATITRLASNHKSLSTNNYNEIRTADKTVGFYSTQSSPIPLVVPASTPDTQETAETAKDQRKSKPQIAIHLRGLKLVLGPELRIVYPLILNFAVSGELELNGLADPKRIKPKGTLTFEDGDVTLLATQVRLKRDHLNRAKFEPDQGLDPNLDLALVGADWQLKVQGRASKWQDNLLVTSPRSGEHDVLSQDEAARVFESQLAESLLEGDGQLAFQKLAAATLKNLMPRIEVSREFGQARWRLVSAPQIPNLLSLDPTVDPFKSLANLSFGGEVEVLLGKRLQASVVRQLKDSEMATQWTLLYQLSNRLRILFQSNQAGENRLLFQYSATSQN